MYVQLELNFHFKDTSKSCVKIDLFIEFNSSACHLPIALICLRTDKIESMLFFFNFFYRKIKNKGTIPQFNWYTFICFFLQIFMPVSLRTELITKKQTNYSCFTSNPI